MSQDQLNQILSQCHNLDQVAITSVIKNLADKLDNQQKSHLLEYLTFGVSADVKAKLVKQLLGDSGLRVIFGQSQVNATNFFNIQSASIEQLSDIMLAIAQVIRNS
ncbi:hypothetical protein PN497_11865 [Sphaerospermopsis kisseleviana CS-549]|uniref:Uncharacterized protein n=2 Tax=Sphaerospermopsis TaxID=752201 RepID=A0A479ZX52_9CYAN|nr:MULTISPECIES: hypothetical protein [Sphaerospermopsis]MBD2135218.1 hypothetical protein [Sphaerospermopsis sp. FACHB-1094]MDB9442051.1 hypothetical protein [Sphaerospermopsis kisseleviana CS-549]BAZ83809.1 hypothetical protein NIES73_50980 [Sphaerospermopsis kisseleviana NIES-73]GCL35751.1 hypothetical protein SR1949_08490 [Sphaerospermopsis reniformis]